MALESKTIIYITLNIWLSIIINCSSLIYILKSLDEYLDSTYPDRITLGINVGILLTIAMSYINTRYNNQRNYVYILIAIALFNIGITTLNIVYVDNGNSNLIVLIILKLVALSINGIMLLINHKIALTRIFTTTSIVPV